MSHQLQALRRTSQTVLLRPWYVAAGQLVPDRKNKLSHAETFFPLHAYVCSRLPTGAGGGDFERSASSIFSDYSYFSSYSAE